jgi:hypothetical protein
MEATILSWRWQNMLTIAVIIVALSVAICLAGQVYAYVTNQGGDNQ